MLISVCFAVNLSVSLTTEPHLIDAKPLNIYHFNDGYQVVATPQFIQEFLANAEKDNPLKLFSGDVVSPSFVSRYFKGFQFIKMFETLKLQAAVVGNHEFDYAEDNFYRFAKETKTDWLLSNFKLKRVDPNDSTKTTFEQIQETKEYKIVEMDGYKIGIMGLVDNDWLEASLLDNHKYKLEHQGTAAKRISKKLKEMGCHLIFVVSHMDNINDQQLLNDDDNYVDMVFGGHNHEFRVHVTNEKLLIKSGSDFKMFSRMSLSISRTPLENFIEVDNSYSFLLNDQMNQAEHPNFKFSFKKGENLYMNINIDKVLIDPTSSGEKENKEYIINKILPVMKEKRKKPMYSVNERMVLLGKEGKMNPLPIHNFFADILRVEQMTDIAILNMSGFRVKKTFEKSDLITAADIDEFFPFVDYTTTFQGTGQEMLEMFEISINMPKDSLAISGASFEYKIKDGKKKINKSTFKIGGNPVDMSKVYSISTNAFLGSGRTELTLFSKRQSSKEKFKENSTMASVKEFSKFASHRKKVSEFILFKRFFSELTIDDLISFRKSDEEDKKLSSKKELFDDSDWDQHGEADNREKQIELAKTVFPKVDNSILRRIMFYSLMNSLILGTSTRSFFEINITNRKSPIYLAGDTRKNLELI